MAAATNKWIKNHNSNNSSRSSNNNNNNTHKQVSLNTEFIG